MDKREKIIIDSVKFKGDKSSAGNFQCRMCSIVDGYSEKEKKCRWCKAELFEMDKV